MSAEIALTDPCVIFALRRESLYFRRSFPFQQHFPGAPCLAQFRGSASQSMLMLESGVGATAMATALHWCLSGPRFGAAAYRPRFVLSVGFSGALQSGQAVGDLILATEIISVVDGGWWLVDEEETPSTIHHPPSTIKRGRLLTVPELVSDPHEKQRLGEQYEALAVDMETSIIAHLCLKYDVPFACLRVISDDLNTPLSPHLVALLRRGRVSPPHLAWTILQHPSLVAELWRLARQTRFAARQLQAGVETLTSRLTAAVRPALEEDGRRNHCSHCPWRP